jgi:hypothetical protein
MRLMISAIELREYAGHLAHGDAERVVRASRSTSPWLIVNTCPPRARSRRG